MSRRKNPRLAAALAQSGITAQTLAARADLHPTTISLTLNLRTVPKPETVRRIAKALGTTPEALFADGQDGGVS